MKKKKEWFRNEFNYFMSLFKWLNLINKIII